MPLTSWHDGRALAEVPLLPNGMNPILRLADDWRLPRHETRMEVLARCGVIPDPIYEWPGLVRTDADPTRRTRALYGKRPQSHPTPVSDHPFYRPCVV